MAGKISKIAVLAPFAAGIGRKPGRFAKVTQDLAPALEVFGQDCVLEVPRTLVADGRVAVPLVAPNGLNPEAWFPQLCRRHHCKEDTEDVQTSAAAPDQPTPPASPLEALLNLVDLPAHPSLPGNVQQRAKLSPESALLDHILQHPHYRSRCSAWQGLSWVHTLAEGIQWLLIDLDPTSCPEELLAVNNLLFEEEPELLLVDLPLSNTPRDQETLALLAGLGDQLLAPVLSWLDSPFWGLDDWKELDRLAYLPTLVEQPQYGKWRSLGNREEARLLCIAVGRMALDRGETLDQFPHASAPLWLAPVWPLAAQILTRQTVTGLPYPLSGSPVIPPQATRFVLEARFTEDRCLQLLQTHQAPLVGNAARITFAGLPMVDGSSFDLQLFLRSLLSWLFSLNPAVHKAIDLQVHLNDSWQQAGIPPPAEIDFTLDHGELFLFIRPLLGQGAGGGEITLQLPWTAQKPIQGGETD
jgi:hypothetical protein